MNDPDARRRRRILFGALIATCLVLITISYGAAAGGAASGPLAPLLNGASAAAKPVRDLVRWFGDTVDATKQRKEMRQELADLRLENSRNQARVRQYDALANMLKLSKQENFDQNSAPVNARVTVLSPNAFASTIRINKGSSAGIKVGDPVVGAEGGGAGLVGFIARADGSSSVVNLLQQSSVQVGAFINGVPQSGIVHGAGAGDVDDLEMDFIPASAQIKPGALVTTAGTVPNSDNLTSIAPKGLPIGRYTRTEGAGDNQVIHLKPLVNLRSLELVQVLTKTSNGNATP